MQKAFSDQGVEEWEEEGRGEELGGGERKPFRLGDDARDVLERWCALHQAMLTDGEV